MARYLLVWKRVGVQYKCDVEDFSCVWLNVAEDAMEEDTVSKGYLRISIFI